MGTDHGTGTASRASPGTAGRDHGRCRPFLRSPEIATLHTPHNTARRAFIGAVARHLARQRVRDPGGRRVSWPGDEEDLRAELATAALGLAPGQAKGLEFDSVIIVDPAGIEQASPRAAPPGAEFPGRPGRRRLAFGEFGLSFRTDGGSSRHDLASRPFA